MALSDPTVRIKLVGDELRRYRVAAGFKLVEAAKRVGIHHTKLSRMETGQYHQPCDEVAGLLAIYGVRGEERKHLLELSRTADQMGLWHRNSAPIAKRIAALRILEAQASRLITFECEIIPGLLQTVPYAQAIMRNVGLVNGEELIGELVAARIARQAILRKPRAPHLCAIIAENALHNLVGDKEIMREQLIYLTEAARRENINLRVIPRSAGNHPGLDGPFLRLQFRDRPAVIVLGNRTSNLFLEDDEDRQVYNVVVVELLSVALDEERSVALLYDLADRLA
jgi:hypothetical protein